MKSSIIINEKPRNVARLQAALNRTQRRASARILTLNRIRNFAAEAERELESLGVPKYLRAGCKAQITPECPPNAYKYRADASAAQLVRRSVGWALESVYRTRVWPIRYGREMGVVLKRSDAAIAHQIRNDNQLADYVSRKIAIAARDAAENAAAEVAAILDPTRLPLVSVRPTVVH